MNARISTLLFTLLLTCTASAQGPAWVRQAMTHPVPSYEKDVPAVVLHEEQSVSLGSDGKLVTTENRAVRLLNNEGRSFAIARAYYLVSAGKVKSIEAWLIRGGAQAKEYDKKSVLDIISDTDDVYNEGRLKVIDGTSDAQAGDIFAYSIVSEDPPLFYQDIYRFQTRLPVLVSRYSLSLPQGWRATSLTFNHADIQPHQAGNNYIWELRNLPPIPPEPLSPSIANLAPRIAVNYFPENSSQGVNRAFADWLDVSRWATTLYDPQVIIDDNMAIKARELTAGAKTELEKIRAIGTYVQNLQYISIDIGVSHGNGYKPRPSNTVLNRGYGDCKDKANLMRALLKVLAIEAYPIAIYSGDPTYVKAEWASPRQFNHCIIAVKVSDNTEASTVIKHPTLGRLLIFDATDQFTPVGDLPDYLQGSQGLIIAGENGGLAKMPITPPEYDLLERRIDVELSEIGELKGTIAERANGQTSTVFRREKRGMSVGDYRKAIEGWLTRGSTGARLVDLQSADRHIDAAFDLDIEFSAPRYGQLMQDRLLIFKPVIVGRRNAVALTQNKRLNPIELDSSMMNETVVFSLPAGFEVDELPDAITLDSPFGSYKTSFEMKDGKLYFSRSYQVKRSMIPAADYDQVKKFYAKMLDAEQSAVVLVKK